MRIKLKLTADRNTSEIPINYQYPLSAAIYKIIAAADNEYALFLHNRGYQKEDSKKAFKLFTFSDLMTPFEIQHDRMILKTRQASLIVCFHVPDAAFNFLSGLFMQRSIEIADKKSKAAFRIDEFVAIPDFEGINTNTQVTKVLRPISPMVIGIKNKKGNYDFLTPEDGGFLDAMIYHWKEKYSAAYSKEKMFKDFEGFSISLHNHNNVKRRLITIKADSPEEVKIRGVMNFELCVTAKISVLELALNAGIGAYCSLGFGCTTML